MGPIESASSIISPSQLSKMKLIALAAAALSLLSPAYGLGHAIVRNRCNYPVYLWSVGSEVGPQHTLQSNQGYSEQLRHDEKTGGITIKISREKDGLWNGSPQLDFGYTVEGNNVWYAIGDVNGDPFANKTVSVTSSNPNCESIVWKDGIPPPGIHPKMCTAEHDVLLTLCEEK